MNILYRLTHEYEVVENNEVYDMVTDIAIYSSLQKAEQALKKFRKHPYFLEHPDGFEISEIEVDKCCWTEGFVSIEW